MAIHTKVESVELDSGIVKYTVSSVDDDNATDQILVTSTFPATATRTDIRTGIRTLLRDAWAINDKIPINQG